MVWVKDSNPHQANNIGLLALSPKLLFALLRNGAIAGLVMGLAVGYWHRHDFNGNQEFYDHVQEAKQRGAELQAQMCHDYPDTPMCKAKKDGKK